MLDFITWLTQQDFGRRCVLSVRDILSWVHFLNTVCERDEDGFMTMGVMEDEEEAEWDLRLDTVTALVHAACLVYIDGIGSGPLTSVRLTSGAGRTRRLTLGFSCRAHGVRRRRRPPSPTPLPGISAAAAEQDEQAGPGGPRGSEGLRLLPAPGASVGGGLLWNRPLLHRPRY